MEFDYPSPLLPSAELWGFATRKTIYLPCNQFTEEHFVEAAIEGC